MNYYYCNRGKCSSCSQIIGTTERLTSIICGCNNSSVSCNHSQSYNVQDITDLEFIEAIKSEQNINENIVLIKI